MSSEAEVDQLYTVAEVAAMMRVSKMTVYRLVQAGTVGCIRFGRSYRVPRQDVRKYLESMSPTSDYSV